MSELLQSGHHADPVHPDADQLSAFAEQALSAHEYQETLAHLAQCSHCRGIVALALPPVDETPQPLLAAPRRSWFSGWNLAWSGTAAAALASLAIVVVYLHQDRLRHSSLAMQPQIAVVQQQAEPDIADAERAPLRQDFALRSARGALRQDQKAGRPEAPQAPAKPGVAGGPVANLPQQGRNASPLFPTAQPASAAANGGPMPAPRTYPDAILNAPLAGTSAPAVPAASAAQRSSTQTVAVQASGQSIDSANVALNSVMASPSPAPSDEKAKILQYAYLSLQPANPLPSGLPTLSMTAANHHVLALDAHNSLFFSEDDGQHWRPVPTQWSGHAVKVNVSVSRPRPVADLPQLSSAAVIAPLAAGAATAPPSPSIHGTVTDQTGAVIPNATVLLSNKETQTALSLKTDSSGRYQSPSLVPGTYQLEAEAPGFQKRLLSGIALAANQSLQSNLTLDIGAATQTVTVNSAQSQQKAPQTNALSGMLDKSASPARKKARATGVSSLPVFEMLTDTGERWISPDGLTWKPAPNSP